MRFVTACLGLAVLAVAAAAQAEPLNLKHVAAGAGWVGHVDFDAARNSTVVQKLWARAMAQHKNVESQLLAIEGLVGTNPAKDVHGLTVYGKQIGKHHGVVILHAKMKKALLQPWIDQIPKRENSTHGTYAVMSWTHEHKGKKHTISASWHGEDRLVVSSGVDDLKAALDVIDGKSASVGLDSGLAGNIPPGTHIMFRATGISKIECKEPLVKQIESFRMVAGEANGESFRRARIVLNNAETATQFKDIAEGLHAVALLATRKDESLQKLIRADRISLEDKTLTVLWSAPAGEVYSVMEKYLTRLEQHMAKHREHRKKGGRDRGHRHGRGDKPADAQPKNNSENDF